MKFTPTAIVCDFASYFLETEKPMGLLGLLFSLNSLRHQLMILTIETEVEKTHQKVNSRKIQNNSLNVTEFDLLIRNVSMVR